MQRAPWLASLMRMAWLTVSCDDVDVTRGKLDAVAARMVRLGKVRDGGGLGAKLLARSHRRLAMFTETLTTHEMRVVTSAKGQRPERQRSASVRSNANVQLISINGLRGACHSALLTDSGRSA